MNSKYTPIFLIFLCTTWISQWEIRYRRWRGQFASIIVSPRGLIPCLHVFATYNQLFSILFIGISHDHRLSFWCWALDCSWEATQCLAASFRMFERGNLPFYPGWSYKKIVGILFFLDRCVVAARWGSRAAVVVVKWSHETSDFFMFSIRI